MIVSDDRTGLLSAYLAAIQAAGNSDPNPSVGAIVVDATGNVLAAGYTQRAGYAHAERHALAKLANRDLTGCTMYVTLEPCCHHGRTPPCVDAIVERRLRRVVIAQRDFAAEVMGRSVALLKAQGVEITEWDAGDFRREKWYTTGPFFFARKYQRPRVLLKWAQTADGSLAPLRGKSGAISGNDAAFMTAALRFWCKLTVASPGTVHIDAPRLTVRPADRLPDLKQAGFSEFAWELIRTQHDLAAKRHDAATLTQTVRPAECLHLAPETMIGLVQQLSAEDCAMRPNWHIRPLTRSEWQNDFAAAFTSVLNEILTRGFNSLLLEAGPNFSQRVITEGFADAIAVYRSRQKHDLRLWGQAGRGNSLSRLLAQSAQPVLDGYTLLEFARMDSDDFLLYVRDDSF